MVADQHGAPTWSRDLAKMTVHVMERVEGVDWRKAPAEAIAGFQGIYHAAGAGETTWHGFAAEAAAKLREREPGAKVAEVDAIPTSEYPTPAKRPANSRMNCEKVMERFGWRMMDWRDSLGEVMKEL